MNENNINELEKIVSDNSKSTHSTVKLNPKTKQFYASRAKEKNAFERMAEWLEEFGMKYYRIIYITIAIATCLVMIGLLLTTVAFLPEFGNPNNPVNNEVSRRYIVDGLKETGAVNIVAGLILDYRAFDTLGESHVLFCAAVSVLILLKLERDKSNKLYLTDMKDTDSDEKYETYDNEVLKASTFILFPIIMILGIYVILNGHISAGGGFSGGAVMGAGLILFVIAFGYDKVHKFFNFNTFKWVSFVGLVSYSILKTYSFYTGANHIPGTEIPKGIAGAIISSGLILPLNICVGLVVCCTMYTFYSLVRKGDM